MPSRLAWPPGWRRVALVRWPYWPLKGHRCLAIHPAEITAGSRCCSAATARTTAAGNSVAAYGQVTALKQGTLTLKLENDNTIDAINVDVNIVACVVVTKVYKDEAYTVKKSEPIEEVKTIKEPKVAMRRVPMLMD